jgi:phosphonate transport system substrate-binding protein
VLGNEEFGMELLVVPEVNGETVYYSYIIVPAESSIGSLEDLKGKTFAFSDPLSNSGRLAPTYTLHQMGETPDSFFEKYIFTYSHDKSIRAVAEKIVHGAAVDSLVYNYIMVNEPPIGAKTKIIRQSSPFGIPPVVVHPMLDQEIKARLRGLFLNMEQDEAGREILNGIMIDRFVLGSDFSYETIRSRARELGW